jgi:ABC-type lipoprotein release transport system permease subunit
VVWWTLPLVWGATILLAALATFFPVGIMRRIQPATALKGE